MSDSPLKLPPLHQAVLDAATVDALFADLAACTRVLAIIPKRAARAMIDESTSSLDLASARAGLRDGSMRGVQIRYHYDGREWCDTLMAGADGAARLVRICTDEIVQTV